MRGAVDACRPSAPVVSLDAACQQVDRVRGVVCVDKLLQRGLGLLRRNAILLCIPAERYQLVARQRVGQLRGSHGYQCGTQAAEATAPKNSVSAREAGGQVAES